jgi:carbon starvation protein
MNTLYYASFGILWLIFAYYWYGRIITKKVIKYDDSHITASKKINDGKDYVPTKASVLFGHHFASIAGAGPIIGPIIAFSFFGWLPAIIWILVGSVFIGAVHDYSALMLSVRHNGLSIVDLSGKVVSKRSQLIFSFFVWVTLVSIQAVFSDLIARTFVEQPEIVVPTFGIIFLALIFGFFVLRTKLNIFAGTIIALIIMFYMIAIGNDYPVHLSHDIWLIITLFYCFVASVLPVWILLQPRDYLSMYILFIGLGMGFIGLFLIAPEFNAPAFTGFNSVEGPMFPILFILIACGAVSGFHSLVSSGTSSKQLSLEHDGKKVAFGGMLFEAALALLVILMIGSVLVWKDGSVNIPIDSFVFQDLMKQSPNIAFGTAFGLTTERVWDFLITSIPYMDKLGDTGRVIGITFGMLTLNAFLLTTLDTSTRLNRYIVQETIGKKISFFENKYIATLVSLVVAYLLCTLNGYKLLWPLFGTSNQLIATITLFIVTFYILGYKSPKWYTLIPAIFMLIVSESALFYNTVFKYIPSNQWHLAVLSAFLFILGLTIAIEALKTYKTIKSKI